MPITIYFSAVSAVLQHWGILQKVVAFIGGTVQLIIGTTMAECFVAVANIFFGPVCTIIPSCEKAKHYICCLTEGMCCIFY